MTSYTTAPPSPLPLSDNYAIVEREYRQMSGNRVHCHWKVVHIQRDDDHPLVALPKAKKPDYREGERFLVHCMTINELLAMYPGLEIPTPAAAMTTPYCVCEYDPEIEVCNVICQSDPFPPNCYCECSCTGGGGGGTRCDATCPEEAAAGGEKSCC